MQDVDTVELFPNGRIAITPKEPDTATKRFDTIDSELRQIRASARSQMITFHLVAREVWETAARAATRTCPRRSPPTASCTAPTAKRT